MFRRSVDMIKGAAMMAHKAIWALCCSRLKPKFPTISYKISIALTEFGIYTFKKILPLLFKKMSMKTWHLPPKTYTSDYKHVSPQTNIYVYRYINLQIHTLHLSQSMKIQKILQEFFLVFLIYFVYTMLRQSININFKITNLPNGIWHCSIFTWKLPCLGR